MATDPLVLAVEAVSFRVPCWRCNGTIRISYSKLMGRPVNHHPVRHPVDDADADAFAEMVDSEIRRRVLMGDYNEDLPLNVVTPSGAA